MKHKQELVSASTDIIVQTMFVLIYCARDTNTLQELWSAQVNFTRVFVAFARHHQEDPGDEVESAVYTES